MSRQELAKKLYPPDEDGEYPWILSNYQPIIDHFGAVLLQVDDEDYQGDSRVLYADAGRGFGYLQFGWGSCSGCDALQGCDNYADLAELIGELEIKVQWMPQSEMLKFFKTHDWGGDYSYNSEEQQQFILQAITLLEESPEAPHA